VLTINKDNIPLGYETDSGSGLDPRRAGNNRIACPEVEAEAWAILEEGDVTGQPPAGSERRVERRLDMLGPAAANLS
jgi:hypothetical protein